MGLYLSVMSACLLLSVRIPALPMLILPLLAALPVVLWRMLCSIGDAHTPYRRLTPLWLAGIYIFIFGTLICAFLSSVWLIAMQPDFVDLYFRQAVEAAHANGLADMYAYEIDTLTQARERHLMPGPLQFVAAMAWATAFLGATMALPVAAVATRRYTAPKAKSQF